MLDVQAIQNGSMSPISVLELMDSTYASIQPISSKNITRLGFVKCSSGPNAACTAETGSDRWIKITPEFVSWLEDRERTAMGIVPTVGTSEFIDIPSLPKMYTEKAEKFTRDYHSLVDMQK
jgi:hypothetical protein